MQFFIPERVLLELVLKTNRNTARLHALTPLAIDDPTLSRNPARNNQKQLSYCQG